MCQRVARFITYIPQLIFLVRRTRHKRGTESASVANSFSHRCDVTSHRSSITRRLPRTVTSRSLRLPEEDLLVRGKLFACTVTGPFSLYRLLPPPAPVRITRTHPTTSQIGRKDALRITVFSTNAKTRAMNKQDPRRSEGMKSSRPPARSSPHPFYASLIEIFQDFLAPSIKLILRSIGNVPTREILKHAHIYTQTHTDTCALAA